MNESLNSIREQIIAGVVVAAVLGLLTSLILLARSKAKAKMDRRVVHDWLQKNTRDEPGESHVTTEVLAKGTCLSEDLVRRVCMSDKHIYRYEGKLELWSLWRQIPESIYEKEGVFLV